MAAVRPLREADVPAAVELFERVYPTHRWRSRLDCQAYFREVLFANPWRDAALPSWAAEEDGRLVGLYAIVPRRMRLRGRALRVAVGCQFLVEPGARQGLITLQLAQACLRGPQDATLADGATEHVRHLWCAMGGIAPPLYSLHWTRPLRPARHALSLAEARAVPLARAARPLAALGDALAARLRPNRFLRERPGTYVEPLGASTLLALAPELLGDRALRPDYDAASLGWLLAQARRKRRHGALRACAVRRRGQVLGWYAYYARHGAAGEVLQLCARARELDAVLRQLLLDAWREGATAVHGRLDPRHAHELSARHCWFRWDGTWTLAHTRDPEIAAALHSGDAYISRLDGEWWLRFLDEDAPRAPRGAHGAAPLAAGHAAGAS